MFGIGNKFGGARRSAPGEKSKVENSGNLVGARLTLSLVSKAHELKSGELATATAKLTALDRIIGEMVADNIDATADIHERQILHSRVQQLESAVAVLLQRQQDAENALTQSKTAERREDLRALLVQLADAGRTVDASITSVTQALNTVLPLMRAVEAYGDSEISYRNKNASLAFSEFLLAACVPMPGCTISLHVMRTPGKTWSDSLPTPDQADQVKG